jgi:uncharacterized protein YbbC (DUF1343 family)
MIRVKDIYRSLIFLPDIALPFFRCRYLLILIIVSQWQQFITYLLKSEIVIQMSPESHSIQRKYWLITFGLLFVIFSCTGQSPRYGNVTTGAERTQEYLPLLKNKRVGIVANHTSVIGDVHLVDSLLSLGVNVIKIFAPEHGFRGSADAGEKIDTTFDESTGLPLVSLYGERMKPLPGDLEDLDMIIYDIQDVGARFYTYISTMHYVMEACAENGIPFLVLDRPNPNGHYVDGPVLDMKHRSFVGMHPVPVVHGMTVAEYARMINGEGWLRNGVKADLHYTLCMDYDHLTLYRLPVRPSPNLQTQLSIYLYPSLCFFEGTVMNVGRGTDFPFMVFGHPRLGNAMFQYTPVSMAGAMNPPHRNVQCQGVDLRDFEENFVIGRKELYLEWLIFAYKNTPRDIEFFNSFFTRLAGTEELRTMIEKGMGASAILRSWQEDVNKFKEIRKKYLLYKDFE